jgi:hypothetical protein
MTFPSTYKYNAIWHVKENYTENSKKNLYSPEWHLENLQLIVNIFF